MGSPGFEGSHSFKPGGVIRVSCIWFFVRQLKEKAKRRLNFRRTGKIGKLLGCKEVVIIFGSEQRLGKEEERRKEDEIGD